MQKIENDIGDEKKKKKEKSEKNNEVMMIYPHQASPFSSKRAFEHLRALVELLWSPQMVVHLHPCCPLLLPMLLPFPVHQIPAWVAMVMHPTPSFSFVE